MAKMPAQRRIHPKTSAVFAANAYPLGAKVTLDQTISNKAQRATTTKQLLAKVRWDAYSDGSRRFIILPNGEHVHPLPATREDELGVVVQTTINSANTAAGSGLHDANCSPS